MKKPTDKQRINFLEKQKACLKYHAEDEGAPPSAYCFLPQIVNGNPEFVQFGTGDTFREAIDDAISKI